MAGVTSPFPPGPAGREDADRPSPLIGRDAEIARLRGLVEPVPRHSQVLIVVGEAGMGKSALLADTARRARSAGMRVLSVSGRETETALGFAGLHQLLRPLLDRVGRLPERQASALLGTLGLTEAPSGPSRLLIGIAVLTLLSDVAEETPLLLVVEDAHWLDRSSLDALAFAASRLDSEQVVLLLGTRGAAPPRGFDRGFPELQLGPLPDAAARRLLDAQPSPPRGRARRQVLDQAAGNPMALIELAKVIAADPAAGRHWELEPLPLTSRLTSAIASRFTTLPADVRRALLIAAIADGTNGDVAAMDLSGLGPGALACAEQLGLVTVDTTGVRFSHPLVRSAVYHSVPFADRAAVHRQVAAALPEQPERRAWHLAAATAGVDEQVASLLEAAAARARRRGDAAAGVLALERAAELTPAGDERARRLGAAATAAIATGDASWIDNLAAKAAAATRDPELRIRARRVAGWSLVWSNQQQAALAALTEVAADASATFPMVAWESLSVAAAVAYQSGDADARRAVAEKLRLLQQVARPEMPAQQRDADALRLWIEVSIGRCHDRSSALRRLAAVAEETSAAHLLYRAGSAAWLLDEPELAMDLLHRSRAEVRGNPGQGTGAAASRAPRTGAPSAGGGSLAALGWVYIDAGRWDDALSFAAEADDFQADIITAAAGLITATVRALRGESGASRSGVPADGGAAPAFSPEHGRMLAARAWHAQGIAALSAGDYLMAYSQLRHLFAEDGTPLHHHVSYLGVADLAAASVRAERQADGREVLERIHATLQGGLSSRAAQLLSRARAILADPASQEAEFDKALADCDGERWPFERAQLQLDYAEWLRRRRRINEAKPILSAALDTFNGLRARPWAQRSEAELRACGVAVRASAVPDALLTLTAQQRQIVYLAAQGHSNRDIADRLFLSPRTVSSHLYRSYPKLGVAGRNQLRNVVDRAEQQPDGGTSRAKLPARCASRGGQVQSKFRYRAQLSQGTVVRVTTSSSTSNSSIRTQFREIDGLQIRYAESEPRQADALLLNPWPESLFAFDRVWDQLAQHAHLVAVDLPGYGHSERRDDLLSPSAMGEFVIRLADAFGLENPHVVGPDVGTGASLFAAARHPGRLRSLVVGSGGAAVPLALGGMLNDWVTAPDLDKFRTVDPRQIVAGAVAGLVFYELPDAVREDYLSSYEGDRMVESMRYVRRYPEELPVLRDLLPGTQTPVEIIAGGRDSAVPPVNGYFLADRLPNSKLDIINAGHFTWEDAPDDYARLTIGWWQQAEAAGQ